MNPDAEKTGGASVVVGAKKVGIAGSAVSPLTANVELGEVLGNNLRGWPVF